MCGHLDNRFDIPRVQNHGCRQECNIRHEGSRAPTIRLADATLFIEYPVYKVYNTCNKIVGSEEFLPPFYPRGGCNRKI